MDKKVSNRLLAECAKEAYTQQPLMAYHRCKIHEKDNHRFAIFTDFENTYRVIAFAGSNDVQDWINNLSVWKKKRSFGKVHAGFLSAFKDVQSVFPFDTMEDTLPVYIVGHSLGGAIALLFAYYYRHKFNIRRVVTFGCPRVGNHTWQRRYTIDMCMPTYRFVNDSDIVAQVPKLNYFHVGKPIYFDSEGYIAKKISFWRRFWRTAAERLEDHGMDKYVELMEMHNL